MLRRLAGNEIDLRCALNAPVAVELTQPELDQILLNLVSNARDAQPERGEVLITTEAPQTALSGAGDRVVLSIHDRGEGMDAMTLARAFEPFFTTKDPGRGIGLGLSTVQAIVTRRGGEIALAQRPGGGTSVRVLLQGETRPAMVLQGPLTAGHAGVLISAQSDFVRLAAQRSLAKEGYRTVLAPTLEQALESLATEPARFAVLVSDARAASISGAELVERARKLAPGLCCVLMADDDDAGLDASLRASPCVTTIRKPFRSSDLLDCVRRALLPPPLVLMVEDDSLTRATQEALVREGFRVLVARSGREALVTCNACADEVSVVMSDFSMSDMDGETLVESLRRMRPDLPIVFVTGRSRDDPALAFALTQTGVDVLTKPVEFGRLARALRSSLPLP